MPNGLTQVFQGPMFAIGFQEFQTRVLTTETFFIF